MSYASPQEHHSGFYNCRNMIQEMYFPHHKSHSCIQNSRYLAIVVTCYSTLVSISTLTVILFVAYEPSWAVIIVAALSLLNIDEFGIAAV